MVLTSLVLTIWRPATGTAVAHRGSVLPAAQLLPALEEVRVWLSQWSPLTASSMVTEKVTVTWSPTSSPPLQLSEVPSRVSVPLLAAASPE